MICGEMKGDSRGFVALVSVLIISAVAGLLVFGTAERSSDQAKIIQAHDISSNAYFLAHACVEEALRKINLSPGGTSPTNLTLATGSCSAVTVRAGSRYTIISQSTVSGFVKTFGVVANRMGGGRMAITSWADQ